MKFQQPLLLLLGGMLAASSVGCSAISAIVTEYRPGTREPSGSSDRLVAIGRVFENQGRMDQAEVMYRRALKQTPRDPVIQEQLQRLTDARNGRKFEADSVSSAIAAADALSPNRSSRRTLATATGRARVNSAAAEGDSHQSTEIAESDVLLTAANDLTTEVQQVPVSDSQMAVQVLPAVAATSEVTVEQVLEALNAPNDHVELLIRGLAQTDSSEVQCLSATLLAECDADNEQIRQALCDAEASANGEQLLLCVASARNERGESDEQTADRLIGLLQSQHADIPIQAAAELRSFSGTDSESACVAALKPLLQHDDSRTRAIAAVTLGDFGTADAEVRGLLQKLAVEDANAEVRDAASAAEGRQLTSADEELPELIAAPRS